MNGEPIDPIPFEQATEELWRRLAAHAGVDLQEHRLNQDDQSPEWRDRELLMQSLWSEARDMLLGIIICRARWWTAEGEKWRRPPPETITTIIRTKGPDEPWGVFVDRPEVESVLATVRPELNATKPLVHLQRVSNSPKRRGRPPKSGAYDDDAALAHMAELRAASATMSITKAAEAAAHLAPGPIGDSKIKRLCRKFSDGQNGEA